MKTSVTVQFAFPMKKVLSRFDKETATRIRKDLDDINSVVWDLSDPVLAKVLEKNEYIEGKRLIRLIRYRTVAEVNDVENFSVFEFDPGTGQDQGIRIERKPIYYYELMDLCESCGWAQWSQTRDLELKHKPRSDIDVTENEEIIITQGVRDLLESLTSSGLVFRPVSHKASVYYQLLAEISVPVLFSSPLKELDCCSICERPRTRNLIDSNGVDLFSLDQTETFEEHTPRLKIPKMETDFGATDLEFGTLGNRPEGAPLIDPMDFPYRSSAPKWLMSSRLVGVLFASNVSGFDAFPVDVL